MTAGEASDGRDRPGAAEDKSREARAGETGTTRFGMEDGSDTLTDTPGPEESGAAGKNGREGGKQ